MVAEKNIIVAFEFGSSAIRGIAGQKEADGSLHILATEQEKISDSIRRGTVYNINKTTSAITRIKERLNEKLGIYITRAYVGIAGQSLHTANHKVCRTYDHSLQITQEMVDELMDENRNVKYTDREILEVEAQEYRLGIDKSTDPIGIQTDRIEGNYQNIIARCSLQENIRNCMHEAGLDIVDIPITPLELAKALLPDTEKRSGCALVDIGAETTTVAIFTKNILRHLVTIPLGGKNATNDLAKLKNLEIEEAEKLKISYGTAQMSQDKNFADRQLKISNERTISEEEIQRIISARYAEIVANVANQINKGQWENDLLSGITLTGSGALMKGLTEAFANMTGFGENKIKLAKQLLATLKSASSVDTSEIGFNSIIALLMSANENCVGEKPSENGEENKVVEEATDTETMDDNETPEETITPEPKKKKGFGSYFGNLWGKMKDMVNEDE